MISSVDICRIEGAFLLLLVLDQPVDPVEGDAAVVADDSAASVRVGQAREHVRTPAAPHVGGVGIEHRFVVRLPVLGERLDDVRIGFVAVGLERIDDHAEAAVRHDGALQRRIGLKADDDLVLAVDVARGVGGDGAGNLRDVEHAFLPLLDEQLLQLVPESSGAARWPAPGTTRHRRRARSSAE